MIALKPTAICSGPALIVFPFVWLLSLPLRLVGITLEAVFALLRALLFLPARLLGWRRGQRHAV